jgi:C1A family cysteine protease
MVLMDISTCHRQVRKKNMTSNKYGLGALKDPEDKRDYLIKDYIAKLKLPTKLDFSGDMLPVRNQGGEGTCTAFGTCAVKESEEKEGYLSPRFLYDRIKQEGGGAYPRDAMKVLLDIGVCPESCQPYQENVNTPACPESLQLAEPNKIKGYARLNTIDEMKQCLYQNGCFTISVAVTDSWFNTPDGYIMGGGNIIGYHCVALVGYDDEMECIKFKNSWGEGWGDKGYGYIGYGTLKNILVDAWSFIDVPEDEETGTEPKPEPEPEKKGFLEKIRELIHNFLKSLGLLK